MAATKLCSNNFVKRLRQPKLLNRPFRAVLLDLDGTLFDTEGEIAAAGNAMLYELGLPEVTTKQSTLFVGRGAAHYVDASLIYSGVNVTPEYRVMAIDCFLRHYESLTGTLAKPYPDVIESLSQLHEAGYQLAVVTNKQTNLAQRLLKQFAVDRLFQLVIGGDAMVHKKPHPWSVLHVCHQLGVPTQQAVFVGDSDNDVDAAKAAQVTVWVVPYGYSGQRSIDELGADRVLSGFRDVTSLLCS
jgi:phosphoglycolate phosphatase